MSSEPINDSLLARAITIITVKVLNDKRLGRFWKHPGGVFLISRFCIKIRPFEDLAEAHTMHFVARHTSIPVPNIHCAFTHRGRSYIVMERISGEMAGRAWAQRLEESRCKILAQLKNFAQQLRAMTAPDEIGVANILGGPIYNARLPGPSFRGPFRSASDFHKSLWNDIELEGHDGVPDDLKELIVFHKSFCSGSVLTHRDLSSLNVLVQGDKVVGIIDWETAGWYPPYWEYSRAWNVNP